MRPLHYRVSLAREGAILSRQPLKYVGNSLLSSLHLCGRMGKEELRERGVPITWEFANDELGVSFIFIRDPEGNLIQCLQRLK